MQHVPLRAQSRRLSCSWARRRRPTIRPGLFRTVDRNARIYQSTAAPGDKPRLLPRLLGPVRHARARSRISAAP